MNIYHQINEKKAAGRKQLAVLVDPDKPCRDEVARLAALAGEGLADYIFVGGSLLTNSNLPDCIRIIKEHCSIPVVLFPGSATQVDANADALLFLSLISGRNPELLIGTHVAAAPLIRDLHLEAIPTGYMLIDSGRMTTALYMSNTLPIPADKNDIAVCTALAGEMLGLKMIYMDAGSGAMHTVREEMVKAVRASITVPLIVGGGIRTPEKAHEIASAGADLIVIGNHLEKNPGLLPEISEAVRKSAIVI